MSTFNLILVCLWNICALLSPTFLGLPVGQNTLYLFQARFMIWNPSWPHQIVFWLQAAISLRFVRIDLKKPEGKKWYMQHLLEVMNEPDLGKFRCTRNLTEANSMNRPLENVFSEPTQMHRCTLLAHLFIGKNNTPLYILRISSLATDWQGFCTKSERLHNRGLWRKTVIPPHAGSKHKLQNDNTIYVSSIISF